MRHQRRPVADVFSFAVGNDGAGERDFDLRMPLEKSRTAMSAPGRYCSSQLR
jgi:hypothetical protein